MPIQTDSLAIKGLTSSGQITSTVATGTPALVIASTTNIPNLNASSLNGATFAAPGVIGSGTASTATFTGLTVSGTGSDSAINAANTSTATDANAHIGFGFTFTPTPASASSSDYRVFNMSGSLTTSQNFTSMEAANLENRINGSSFTSSSINSLAAVNGTGLIAGSGAGSGAFGTIANVYGGKFLSVNSFSNTKTGTITVGRGVAITEITPGTLTVTNSVGLSIDPLTHGTNNTSILLGSATTPTPATGSWGIYQQSSVPNLLSNVTLTVAAPTVSASQVGLGSTTATTVGAAGAASALPANPVGYLVINVAGTAMKVPYYNN